MNSNITQLDITKVEPYNGQSTTALNSKIKISFTRDLDKSSVARNVLIIEDLSGNIETIEDLSKKVLSFSSGKMSYSNPFKPVQGIIEYNDKVITFIPNSMLEIDKSYCIIVRSNITSIYDEKLSRDYLFRFNTKGDSIIPENKINPPLIEYPTNFSILSSLSEVSVASDNTEDGVYVQISTSDEFNNIVFEFKSYYYNNKIAINKKLEDNNYYLRVKTLKSEWSDPINFYIQQHDIMPVSVDDINNDIDSFLEQFLDRDELNITVTGIEGYKKTNTNKIVFTIDSIIDIDSIGSIEISSVRDMLNDEYIGDDYYNIDSYSVLIDNENNKTTIMIEV